MPSSNRGGLFVGEIMKATCRWGCAIGLLYLFGVFGGEAKYAQAADVPAQQLQPIPTQPAVAPQASPFREESPGVGAVAGEACADGCDLVCGPEGRFWFRADYLMWFTSGMDLPPLVSTDTDILYGGDTVNSGGRSGFRTTLGLWLDACHVWGAEFDYLSLGEMASNYTSPFSSGDPMVVRPFYNVQTGDIDGEIVAQTDVMEGTVSVNAKDYFQSAGVTLTRNLCSSSSCDPCDSCDPCKSLTSSACDVPYLRCCRTDLLIGFRYYNLSDRVVITENLRDISSTPANGTTFLIHDNFSARNDFYGSEVGLRTQLYRGRWSFEILTKIALGNNHQTVTISGEEYKTVPGSPTVYYPTGIFATEKTNMGTYQRDSFAMIPQLGLEVGYQVNRHWRTYIGYNILYWGSVLRSGDQIDLNVDTRNWPGVDQTGTHFPAYSGNETSFWAQGINVGSEFRF